MEFQPAKRMAVPLLIAIASPTGCGKTYSALLMAAGLAGTSGRIGLIDTEMGRGAMYADDADLLQIMPQGYEYLPMNEPFEPGKYIECIRKAKNLDVLIIDSVSHEWEGFGGCTDIAENNKLRGMPNWAKAKLEHKRFMNVLTQSKPHIILCLRAREKTKPVKTIKDGKEKVEMVEMGMTAIQEKNFMFEMTVSMMLDENHRPNITKCPKPLKHLFEGEQTMVTKETGEKLRAWAAGGAEIDTNLRSLKQEAREAAMFGNERLNTFLAELSPENKALLNDKKEAEFRKECRHLATEADKIIAETDAANQEIGMFAE